VEKGFREEEMGGTLTPIRGGARGSFTKMLTGWSTAAARAAYYTFREFSVPGSAGDRIDVRLASHFFDEELQQRDLRIFSLQAQTLMSPDDSVFIGNNGRVPPLCLAEGGSSSSAPSRGAGGQ
jgi:hypothetical protein